MITLIKKKGTNPQDKSIIYFPQWTRVSTVNSTQLAKRMARGSTFSVGEINGVFNDFPHSIIDELLDGNAVEIAGLGTYKLKVSGKSQKEKKDVTSAGAKISVVFEPAAELLSRLNNEKEFRFVEVPTPEGQQDADEGGETPDTGGDNGGTGSISTGDQGDQGGTSTGDDSGTSTGSDTGGQQGSYRLVIYKYGGGTMTVTDGNGQVINSNDNVASSSTVNISVVPVAGKVPTAQINGTNIPLTENNGTYTGSFQMPTRGTSLEINSNPSGFDED